MADVQDLLAIGKEILSQSELASIEHVSEQDIQLDAEILLAHCLDKSRTFIKTWPEHRPSEEQTKTYLNTIQRRAELYPVAYIIGTQEFWSLSLSVNENVLIPRPETECLIEFILEHFKNNDTNVKGLDLGTGSGAIVLALASEHQNWRLQACDTSEAALKVASKNAKELNLKSVEFFISDWLNEVERNDENRFDFIVSNPPYLRNDAIELNSESIRHEPASALSSGHDGLVDIRTICEQAPQYLKINGLLTIEHGADQGEEVTEIFKQQGFFEVECHQDYAGLDRFTTGLLADKTHADKILANKAKG